MQTIIYLTLMHSLWLGLILAAVAGLVLLFTRQSAAGLRDRLLTASLALFAVSLSIIVTKAVGDISLAAGNGAFIPEFGGFMPATPGAYSLAGLIAYISNYSTYIVWTWVAVIIARSLRLSLGLRRLHHLRHHSIYSVGDNWQQYVDRLCRQMGITRPVAIMQSALTSVPLMLGHFKPLILIPVGLVNNLPVAEVEAIICHELAHIKRKDYLVNLLQTCLDILFFFNPAVIWVNALIRKEREHCCDDLALSANVSLRDYISALVSCQQYKPAANTYAIAFAAGNKGQLLQRVRRISGNNKGTINSSLRVLSALLVCATLALAVAFCTPGGSGIHVVCIRVENEQIVKEIKEIDNPEMGDTSPGDTSTLQPRPDFTEDDGINMHNELQNDGIIKSLANTTYLLDKDRLIVNNIRQPAAIHKKYFEKYVKYPERIITYNYTYKGNS